MYRYRVFFPLLLVAFLLLAPVVQADGPIYSHPNERFGVDMVRGLGAITDYDVVPLRIAFYSDWGRALAPVRPGGMEYVQVVRLREGVLPSLAGLDAIIAANPGSLWVIGNEPECIYQDNSLPETYAEAYHDAYLYIKGRDPSARIAIGGVVQPTPLRFKWLDRVLDHYQAKYGAPMPVDVWNIHNLILQERKGEWGCDIPRGLIETSGRLYALADNDSMRIFMQHIVDFRVWMRDRGYRDRPLIVSEYGVLMPPEYGFTAERIRAFMNASFDYMLTARDDSLGYPADGNRLVQRWAWNSLNDQPYDLETGLGFNGALFDYRTRQITPLGSNYRSYTDALAAGRTCLTGAIGLQGRPAGPAPSYAITGNVTLYPQAGGEPIERPFRSDATGHLGICDLLPGTYGIVIKGDNTLSRRINGVQVTANGPILDLGTLLAGDANNDNRIDILDFTILATAYGKSLGEQGFDARGDLNGDGRVDMLDYSLLAANYLERGVR